MKSIDQFISLRHEYKGIYVATMSPTSTKVLAKASDYGTLEALLEKKHLLDKPIAIQYLEPKRVICAYGISVPQKNH